MNADKSMFEFSHLRLSAFICGYKKILKEGFNTWQK